MIVANQVEAVGPEDRRDGQAVPGQHYGLVHSYKVFCAVGGVMRGGTQNGRPFRVHDNFAKIEFVVINTNSHLNRIVNISIYNLFCYTHQIVYKWSQHLTNSSNTQPG